MALRAAGSGPCGTPVGRRAAPDDQPLIDLAVVFVQLAERAVGARGLLQPSPIERIIRDLTLYLRQPSPDAAQASVGRLVLECDRPIDKVWHD